MSEKKTQKKKKYNDTTSRCKKNPKKKSYANERERHLNKDTMGRPTDYNEEIANEICEAVATSSLGLTKLCEINPHFPARDTIYRWRWRYPMFSDKFNEAKKCQAELGAEEMLEIADDAINDYMENVDDNKKVGYTFKGENVQRSKLRVETRKWIASKLLPKAYGTNMQEQVNESVTLVEKMLKDAVRNNEK